jgi:hypothetical protein
MPEPFKKPFQFCRRSFAIDPIDPNGCWSRPTFLGRVIPGIATLFYCRQFEVAVDVAIILCQYFFRFRHHLVSFSVDSFVLW